MTALKTEPTWDPVVEDAELDEPLQRQQRDIRPIPRISIQAFCETHEIASAFENALADRRMSRAHLRIQTGGINAAIEYYREASTPNLVVLETTDRRQKILEQIEQFAEVCDPATKVIIIGHVNDILLYRELVRQGISEYVVAPQTALDIVEVVSNLYADPKAKPIGRTIAFVGAKGGVGASTIAHNVAWLLSRDFESDTLVADLDLAFGTAGLDFNADPPQGVADAVFSPDRLDQTFLDRLLANCGDRLNLLAAPSTLDRTYDLAESALESLLDVVRNNSPYVVLDVPHIWTAWARKTLVAADEIVVVAMPDLANLRNAKNLIDTLKNARPHDPMPRLVLNQVGLPKRPEIKAADFAKSLEVPLAATVPFDAQLFGTAANNGQMLAEVQKNAKTVEALRALAETLSGRATSRRSASVRLPLLSKIRSLLSSKAKT
jgi:pilus assembly protein CpaE